MKNAVDFVNDLFGRFSDSSKSPMQFDTNYHECPMCFNSGFVETARTDFSGRQYRGVIRCLSCDYWFKLAARLGAKE